MKYNEFIKLKTLEQFKDKALKIIDNPLPFYYKEYIESKDNVGYYFQLQDYICGVRDSRYRYIEVSYDNDLVCFIIKIIQFMNTKSIKIIGLPISKNNELNHIYDILDYMFNLDIYVSLLINEQDKNFIGLKNIPYSKQDFNYYSTNKWINNRFTHKFFKKHKIHNLPNVTNFIVTEHLSKNQQQEFLNLFEEWSKHKANVKGKREFKNLLNYNNCNNNIKFLLLYYENDLVLIRILIRQKNGFVSVFSFNKSRTIFDNHIKNRDLHNIVLYSQYITSNYIKQNYNCDKLYILGANPKAKGLLPYKENNNENKDLYYICKKNDWLINRKS